MMRWSLGVCLGLLVACPAGLLEAERSHCVNGIECEFGQRCVAQRCVANADTGAPEADAGQACDGDDGDGASGGGRTLQRAERLTDRHVCAERGDTYRYHSGLGQALQLIVVGDGAPALQLAPGDHPRDPSIDCDSDEVTCAGSGGLLTALAVEGVVGTVRLGASVTASSNQPYELIWRAGGFCVTAADCASNEPHCVFAPAPSAARAERGGVCVRDEDLLAAPECDAAPNIPSDHAEDAPEVGELRQLNVSSVPTCADDDDWYRVQVSALERIELSLSVVSVAAQSGELDPLIMYLALHRVNDAQAVVTRPVRLRSGVASARVDFGQVQPGSYSLRVTQLNRRALPSSYSITPAQ
jgi:hypothetical protein